MKKIPDQPFTFIVGKEVTKRARSPILWMNAYQNLSIKSTMIAIDCEEPREFIKVMCDLSVLPNCKGGLFAYPLKNLDTIFSFETENYLKERLECLTGVKNAIKFTSGARTENFDTLAILEIIRPILSERLKPTIVIVGYGNVATDFLKRLLAEHRNEFKQVIVVTDRQVENKYSNRSVIFQKSLKEKLDANSVILNLGISSSLNNPGFSSSLKQVLNHSCRGNFVFNVNYGMKNDYLKDFCVKKDIDYIDGGLMNRIQAAMSFLWIEQLDLTLDEIMRSMDGSNEVER